MLAAASKGDHEEVNRLIGIEESVLVADKLGRTTLHWMCQQGHSYVVRRLIDEGAVVEAATKDTKETPLHWSSSRGHMNVVWDGGSMATVRALVGFCRPVAGVDDVGLRSVVGLMAVVELHQCVHQTRRSGVVGCPGLVSFRVVPRHTGGQVGRECDLFPR